MKQPSLLLVLIASLALAACQQASESDNSADSSAAESSSAAAGSTSLTDEKESLSYALGISLGKQMNNDSIEVDLDKFSSGYRHGMGAGEGDPLMTPTEVQQRLQVFQEKRNKLAQAENETRKAEYEAASVTNREEGVAWLAENAGKDGVKTTESGLQYKVLTAGTGEKPSAEDTVSVHYRGTLLDGTEFDSSYSRGEPTEFPVNRVIPGWTEALQLMPVGSKWEVYIPSDLAYGPAGTGREIGPNATLMFEVELLEIKAPQAAVDGAAQ